MTSLDFQFRFDKALQAVGLFLRLNDGHLNQLKLLKLLYLADRESLATEGDSITGDQVLAMPKGPVLSTVYNLIKGTDSQSYRWHRYIKKGEDHFIFIVEDPGTDDLCRFEKEIIGRIDQQYKEAHALDLVNLTHTFPEWKQYKQRLNTRGLKKSYRISNEEILAGMNKMEMIKRVQENIAAERFHRELLLSQ